MYPPICRGHGLLGSRRNRNSRGPRGSMRYPEKFYPCGIKPLVSKVLSLSFLPWKSSHFVFSRAQIKAIAQSFCSEHLAGLACVPRSWPVESAWPCAMWDRLMQVTEQVKEAGAKQVEWEREGTFICLGIMSSQIFMGLHLGSPSQPMILFWVSLTGKHLYVAPTSLCMCPSSPLLDPFPQ